MPARVYVWLPCPHVLGCNPFFLPNKYYGDGGKKRKEKKKTGNKLKVHQVKIKVLQAHITIKMKSTSTVDFEINLRNIMLNQKKRGESKLDHTYSVCMIPKPLKT